MAKEKGLELNKGKCVHLAMNDDKRVRFEEGEEVKREREVIYLGARITDSGKTEQEVQRRINECRRTLKNLDPLWKCRAASRRHRLIIFNMVVKAKLMYGLETCRITEQVKTKVDAFQIQALRKICGLKHVYYDRTMTNDRVRQIATQLIGEEITPMSRWLERRNVGLWAHLIRAEQGDIVKYATLDDEREGDRKRHETRRKGRPRKQWNELAEENAWNTMDPILRGTEETFEGTAEQRNFLIRAAKERCI